MRCAGLGLKRNPTISFIIQKIVIIHVACVWLPFGGGREHKYLYSDLVQQISDIWLAF